MSTEEVGSGGIWLVLEENLTGSGRREPEQSRSREQQPYETHAHTAATCALAQFPAAHLSCPPSGVGRGNTLDFGLGSRRERLVYPTDRATLECTGACFLQLV